MSTVALGNATTADVTLGATSLEEIEVLGTRIVTAVDVKSTESATNVTREELERLPVDRTVSGRAAGAGPEQGRRRRSGGVSFGGSSVAENTVYVNGLNVTDFYNRIGFSSVPFAFYEEFQVKTGGYSVEFGRTTGGVINAVTRSGTNEFQFGTEVDWEPSFLQATARRPLRRHGRPYIIEQLRRVRPHQPHAVRVRPDRAGQAVLLRDVRGARLPPRQHQRRRHHFYEGKTDDGFWGAKVDWQINDRNLLELLAFSDKNDRPPTSTRSTRTGDTGRRTEHAVHRHRWRELVGDLHRLPHRRVLDQGAVRRERARLPPRSLNDIDCNRVRDRRRAGAGDLGCTSTATWSKRARRRARRRAWISSGHLGDHRLRFGLDHENNTSRLSASFYPGPDGCCTSVRSTEPGATLDNGGVVPAGATAYVRTRTQRGRRQVRDRSTRPTTSRTTGRSPTAWC